MKNGPFFPLLCFLIYVLLHAGMAGAAQENGMLDNFYTLDQPVRALISPAGGHLECSAQRSMEQVDGSDVVWFVIPADATNLHLNVPGRTIIRYESVPVSLNTQSTHSGYREKVRQEEMRLSAQLATVQASIQLLSAAPGDLSVQDLAQRQNLLQQKLPALAEKKEELQRDLAMIRDELARMPESGPVGSKIIVLLVHDQKAPKNTQVNFSYDILTCGWEAVYNFDARPDNPEKEIVDVRLLAEVWQYTGIDWTNAEMTLVTQGNGPREPWPLPDWVVGAPAPQPKAVAHGADGVMLKSVRSAAPETAAVTNLSIKAPPVLPVHANSDDVYASWKLATKGLPEGRSRLQIMADAWHAPLQWLARPSKEDNRVWMLAKYTLPGDQAWPAGVARYSVNGQSVGNGQFTPGDGEATLYFGPDPRVTVRTTFDSSKQGETGIINTNKTWSWAWTYTLHNLHARPVKVRVERPAPMIANESISVQYKDKPRATVDEKEHLLWWLVDVPGNGKSVIEHGVTIAAPEKLSLVPYAP